MGTTLTASFGVAERLADTNAPDSLVDLADQALLVAKRSGRDRVVGFQSLTSSTRVRDRADKSEAMFDGHTAGQVMTTIVAGLNEEDSVGGAARHFLRFRFTSAPVVDHKGKLVGILSERDVMSIMMWPDWWKTKIKDVMKRNVVCYEETASVISIYEFLCRVSLRGVVIVRDGRPTGMISRSSLLRWYTNMLVATPGSMMDVTTAEEDLSEDSSPRLQPRKNAAMIARALIDEATQLETRIESEQNDLVPAVVGSVSRVEELLNDLLAFSRDANVICTPLAENAAGTPASLIGSSSDRDEAKSVEVAPVWNPDNSRADHTPESHSHGL